MAISYKDQANSHKYHFIHIMNKLRVCGFKKVTMRFGGLMRQLLAADEDGMRVNDGLIEVSSIGSSKEYLKVVPIKEADFDPHKWPGA